MQSKIKLNKTADSKNVLLLAGWLTTFSQQKVKQSFFSCPSKVNNTERGFLALHFPNEGNHTLLQLACFLLFMGKYSLLLLFFLHCMLFPFTAAMLCYFVFVHLYYQNRQSAIVQGCWPSVYQNTHLVQATCMFFEVLCSLQK